MDKANELIASKTQKFQRAWNEFMKSGKESSAVAPEILASWKRCRSYQVDPADGKGKKLPQDVFLDILKRKTSLIEISRSIMEVLHNIVKDSSNAIILTDENGVILETISNELSLDRMADLNFAKGCQWREENVGTNAIGTALFLNRPIQTLGAEHYCSIQHSWTCSAAPIRNQEGKVIGLIDISGDYSDYHPHTLGMVVAAADAIEKHLNMMEQRNWTSVTYNSIEDGLLTINTNIEIKDHNHSLCEILEISEKEFEKLDIKHLLKDVLQDQKICDLTSTPSYREENLYLNDKRVECGITISPVVKNDVCLGSVITVKKLDRVRSVVNQVAGNTASYRFDQIITQSEEMTALIQTAKKMAKNEYPILIQGESGTGKELFAHAIHSESERSKAPFIAINCAALPKDLVESELFGYEKGAFTGASSEGKPGKFELANGGTLFLDEVGELPLSVQAKLLRVLDNYAVTRIGGTYERALDVRVLAATNRNLNDEISHQNFRSDLFYRLNVLNITLLPLRERTGDIVYCAEYFLQQLNKKSPEKDKRFTPSFIKAIETYEWKGNLRELQNIVQRACYISDGEEINEEALPNSIVLTPKKPLAQKSAQKTVQRIRTLEEMERELLTDALASCQGNVVEASKLVGIGKSTFYRKVKAYQIDVSHFGKS